MPSIQKRNAIEGRREIEGFTIKFTAIFVDTAGLFQIKIIDHFGEQTSDFAPDHEVFGAIGELVERAVEACRERTKEMADAQ